MYAATRTLTVERLRRLNSATQEIVLLAALLGYRPDLGALAVCAEVALVDLLAALERAGQVDLVVAESRVPAVYRFRHALTRAAVCEALEPATRRALHARIAARLESLPDAEARVEALAYHWMAAGNPAKASAYWERSAEAARRIGAHDDAERYAERARGLASLKPP